MLLPKDPWDRSTDSYMVKVVFIMRMAKLCETMIRCFAKCFVKMYEHHQRDIERRGERVNESCGRGIDNRY